MGRPKKENNKNQQKQPTRSRPGTPEQQPNKRQNTLQTTEPESSVSNKNNNIETSAIMDVDPLPLDKGKGREVLTSETTLVITPNQSSMNVDDANDASENFLDKKKSPQEISTKKTNFFAFFPADDYPGKSPQTKISDVIDLIFDQFDSFSGVVLAKHPEDQTKKILKATFSDKVERDAFCDVNLPNLDKRTFLPSRLFQNIRLFHNSQSKLLKFHWMQRKLELRKSFPILERSLGSIWKQRTFSNKLQLHTITRPISQNFKKVTVSSYSTIW